MRLTVTMPQQTKQLKEIKSLHNINEWRWRVGENRHRLCPGVHCRPVIFAKLHVFRFHNSENRKWHSVRSSEECGPAGAHPRRIRCGCGGGSMRNTLLLAEALLPLIADALLELIWEQVECRFAANVPLPYMCQL